MLILVRHGRTTANAQGLLQGRVDNPLDDTGIQQARDVAAHLSATSVVTGVIASPLVRAQTTAAPIAAAAAVSVETDDRFVELSYGEWEEKPLTDVPADIWEQWRTNLDFRPPGGETLNELGARVREGLEDLRSVATEQDVVMVSHVSPMKAALGWALQVDDQVSWRIHIAHASVCRIGFRGGRPVVLSVNENSR